jgi:hypothetical protein
MHSPASFLFRIAIVAAVAAAVSLAPKWGGRWVPGAPSQAGVAPLQEPGMSGRARVLDGDSIEFAGESIRLFGIDAPEGRQVCRDASGRPYRCGRAATRALAAATAGRTIACTRIEHRGCYDRQIAICTADGRAPRRHNGAQPRRRPSRIQPWPLCRGGARGPHSAARPVGRHIRAAIGVAAPAGAVSHRSVSLNHLAS